MSRIVTHYIVNVTRVSEDGAFRSLTGMIQGVRQYATKDILEIEVKDNPVNKIVKALSEEVKE